VRVRKLDELLARHRRIGIDTLFFIYWVESGETYGELVQPIFVWFRRPRPCCDFDSYHAGAFGSALPVE